MLGEAKKDFIVYARTLDKPYEEYKIDELATAYCNACDAGDEWGKSVYISALVLRFWYQINKMYMANPLQTHVLDGRKPNVSYMTLQKIVKAKNAGAHAEVVN